MLRFLPCSLKLRPRSGFPFLLGPAPHRGTFRNIIFDAVKKLVVVVAVAMREGELLHTGNFRKLHGLIEAAMSPPAPFLQFLGRVLLVMN